MTMDKETGAAAPGTEMMQGVLVKGKNGSTPMKDTGALYNDFDYEIKER